MPLHCISVLRHHLFMTSLGHRSRPRTSVEYRRRYWDNLRRDPERLQQYNMRKAKERKRREERRLALQSFRNQSSHWTLLAVNSKHTKTGCREEIVLVLTVPRRGNCNWWNWSCSIHTLFVHNACSTFRILVDSCSWSCKFCCCDFDLKLDWSIMIPLFDTFYSYWVSNVCEKMWHCSWSVWMQLWFWIIFEKQFYLFWEKSGFLFILIIYIHIWSVWSVVFDHYTVFTLFAFSMMQELKWPVNVKRWIDTSIRFCVCLWSIQPHCLPLLGLDSNYCWRKLIIKRLARNEIKINSLHIYFVWVGGIFILFVKEVITKELLITVTTGGKKQSFDISKFMFIKNKLHLLYKVSHCVFVWT